MEANPRSLRKLRKQLSAPGLLDLVRRCFEHVKDPCEGRCEYTLPDTLMSGLAMFMFKSPSMLRFDRSCRGETADPVLRHNLKRLYGVAKVPSDSSLRRRLDGVTPKALQRVFGRVFEQARRHKALTGFQALGGYHLLAVDGTGQFASDRVHCKNCCEQRHREGRITYYHQLLAGVLVHPSQSTVVPLAPEPIVKGDGQSKNDCEQTAAKRLLARVRRAHPHLKLVVMQDALGATAPQLALCRQLDLRFLMAVKPGSHAHLFEAIGSGAADEWFADDSEDGRRCARRLRLVRDVPLNEAHRDTVRVTVLQAHEVPPKGRTSGKPRTWTWITDLPLTRAEASEAQACARSRWKIENETFNTLKNQGYQLEHNFGHGNQHLATVLMLLMMLAFLIDQLLETACPVIQQIFARYHSRIAVWERLRSSFRAIVFRNWQELYGYALGIYTAYLAYDTS